MYAELVHVFLFTGSSKGEGVNGDEGKSRRKLDLCWGYWLVFLQQSSVTQHEAMGISWADSQAPAVLKTRLPSAQQWSSCFLPSEDFQNPADWGNFCCETGACFFSRETCP